MSTSVLKYLATIWWNNSFHQHSHLFCLPHLLDIVKRIFHYLIYYCTCMLTFHYGHSIGVPLVLLRCKNASFNWRICAINPPTLIYVRSLDFLHNNSRKKAVCSTGVSTLCLLVHTCISFLYSIYMLCMTKTDYSACSCSSYLEILMKTQIVALWNSYLQHHPIAHQYYSIS